MLSDEVLAKERAHRMAEKDDRRAGIIRGDAAIDLPQIGRAFGPAILWREETEILGRLGRTAMAAMVVGIDGIARAGQCLGQPGITAAMLGQAMRDLHGGARRPVRCPAIDEQLDAIFGYEPDARRFHASPEIVIMSGRSPKNAVPASA